MDTWRNNYKSMNLDSLIKEKRRLDDKCWTIGDKQARLEYINSEIALRYDKQNKEFHSANHSH